MGEEENPGTKLRQGGGPRSVCPQGHLRGQHRNRPGSAGGGQDSQGNPPNSAGATHSSHPSAHTGTSRQCGSRFFVFINLFKQVQEPSFYTPYEEDTGATAPQLRSPHPSTPLHNSLDRASYGAATVPCTHRLLGLLPSPPHRRAAAELPPGAGDAGGCCGTAVRAAGQHRSAGLRAAATAAVPPPHRPVELLGVGVRC